MSKQELESFLVQLITIEHQNSKNPRKISLGQETSPSMFATRKNRIRLAKYYSKNFGPVSKLLFNRNLPQDEDWPGTGNLVSTNLYNEFNGKWYHVACTVPIDHFCG